MASREPSRRAPGRDRRARTILAGAVAVGAVVLVALALDRSKANGPFSGPTLLPSRAAPVPASTGGSAGSGGSDGSGSAIAGSEGPSASPPSGGAAFDPRTVNV